MLITVVAKIFCYVLLQLAYDMPRDLWDYNIFLGYGSVFGGQLRVQRPNLEV
jgi:hypothetical protein